MAKLVDWDSIEIQYVAGARSLRAIASDFGITETAIRQRARKYGWVRNTASLKREMVNARLSAGTSSPPETSQTSQTSQETSQESRLRIEIEREVLADIEDMERGLRINRTILIKIERDLLPVEDPKGFQNYKTAADAARLAIEAIRRIRGLDAPDDLSGLTDDQVQAIAEGRAFR